MCCLHVWARWGAAVQHVYFPLQLLLEQLHNEMLVMCESTGNPTLLPSCWCFCPAAEVTQRTEMPSKSLKPPMYACVFIQRKKFSRMLLTHFKPDFIYYCLFPFICFWYTEFHDKVEACLSGAVCICYLLHLKSRCSQANLNILSKSLLWNANELAMSA